jgi:hypothetical protein
MSVVDPTKLPAVLVDRIKTTYQLNSIAAAKAKYDNLLASDSGRKELVSLISFSRDGDFTALYDLVCGTTPQCISPDDFQKYDNNLLRDLSRVMEDFTNLRITIPATLTEEKDFWSVFDQHVETMNDPEWFAWFTRTRVDEITVQPLITTNASDQNSVINTIARIAAYTATDSLIPKSFLIKRIREILSDPTSTKATFKSFILECIEYDRNFLIKYLGSNTLPNYDSQIVTSMNGFDSMKTKATISYKSLRKVLIAAIDKYEYINLYKTVLSSFNTPIIYAQEIAYDNGPVPVLLRALNDQNNHEPLLSSLKQIENTALTSMTFGTDIRFNDTWVTWLRQNIDNTRAASTYPNYNLLKSHISSLQNTDKTAWENWRLLLISNYIKTNRKNTPAERATEDTCILNNYLCRNKCSPINSSCDSPPSPAIKNLDAIIRLKENLMEDTDDISARISRIKLDLVALCVFILLTVYNVFGLRYLRHQVIYGTFIVIISIIVCSYIFWYIKSS